MSVPTQVIDWYRQHQRSLPWRDQDVSPWGVLVSEIMLQQTPAARVEPRWRDWMDRWPTPADLAAAPSAQILQAWGRLGYPRRALRLQSCAAAIVERHGGAVPSEVDQLRALPGIGEYTAAAVACFAYGKSAVVLDTNVRRVLARCYSGIALPPPSLGVQERELARTVLDEVGDITWNVAAMELGAMVCRAREADCTHCPVAGECAWRAAGFPQDAFAHRRRTQAWRGTDRQLRGWIVERLRAGRRSLAELHAEVLEEPITVHPSSAATSRSDQFRHCVESLIDEGLIHPLELNGESALALGSGAKPGADASGAFGDAAATSGGGAQAPSASGERNSTS